MRLVDSVGNGIHRLRVEQKCRCTDHQHKMMPTEIMRLKKIIQGEYECEKSSEKKKMESRGIC